MRKKGIKIFAAALAFTIAMGDCSAYVYAANPLTVVEDVEDTFFESDIGNAQTSDDEVVVEDISVNEDAASDTENSAAKAQDSNTTDGETSQEETSVSEESSIEASDSDDQEAEASDSDDQEAEASDRDDQEAETSDSDDQEAEASDSEDQEADTSDSEDQDAETSDNEDHDAETSDNEEQDTQVADGDEEVLDIESDIQDEAPGNVEDQILALSARLDSKVYGTDGTCYSGIDYLSYRAYLSLDDAAQAEYLSMCDEAASMIKSGEVENVVLSTDEKGNLSMGYFVPLDELTEQAEDLSEDLLVTINTETDIAKEELPPDGDDIDIDNLSEGEKSLLGINSYVEENEEELEDVLVDEEFFEIPADEPLGFVPDLSENQEEYTDTFDTLISVYDSKYFYNQLDSYEKKIFDLAKSPLTSGSNSVSFTVNYSLSMCSFADAISALMTSYSSSFGWVDKSSGAGFSVSYCYSCCSGNRSYKLTVQKSKYYNATLAKQCSTQVKTLVNEAYEYAKANYPQKPTFGMVYYFDEWLCANNYYNNAGVARCSADKNCSTYYYCHSPYGCLLKGYGVCESYALAMSMLLDKSGITNIYVVGSAGGGHAWNYVYMPNGNWYLQDSTWNDSTNINQNYSTKNYLLTKMDSRYAEGQFYCSGSDFKFPSISTSAYTYSYTNNGKRDVTPLYDEPFNISQSLAILKPKQTFKLTINNYYKDYKKTWASDNTYVAKVDSKGKVSAVHPGKATISCNISGRSECCEVYVYSINSLMFDDGRRSISQTYVNQDMLFDESDAFTVSLNVYQLGEYYSAEELCYKSNIAKPAVSSSKKSVAYVDNISLVGDRITFKVHPRSLGGSTLTINFAGKKATVKLSVKEQIQDKWFYLSKEEYDFNNKAKKPTVKRSGYAPGKVPFKVTYLNNKYPGEAQVIITGKGNYYGTVTKKFKIN